MLIGLIGYPQAGKDSVATILRERNGFTRVAFADKLREMAAALNPFVHVGANKHYALADGTATYNDVVAAVGYTKAKEFADVREFLQRLGTEAVRVVLGPNVWVDLAFAKVFEALDNGEDVVITDVRFENELQTVRDCGGYLVRVNRPGFGPANDHVTEQFVASADVDINITASNLEELEQEVVNMLDTLAGLEDAKYSALSAKHFPQHELGAANSPYGGINDAPIVFVDNDGNPISEEQHKANVAALIEAGKQPLPDEPTGDIASTPPGVNPASVDGQ